jgi:hypothetical protein
MKSLRDLFIEILFIFSCNTNNWWSKFVNASINGNEC